MKKIILLTGAGFSKNFGGFLGKEIWEHVFNDDEVQNSQPLRNLLSETYNYETVYQGVLEDTKFFSDSEKAAIEKAVLSAYHHQEDMYIPIDGRILNDLCDFLQEHVDVLFTLNHDSFIEKHFMQSMTRRELILPPWEFDLNHAGQTKILPTKDKLAARMRKIDCNLKNGNFLNYIKLHGSINWLDSKNEKTCVIVGGDKKEQIEKEPLLKYYYKLLQNFLLSSKRKLLIIGYGFMDNHINEIVAEGIQSKLLDVHVIETQDYLNFRDKMKGLKKNGPYLTKLTREEIEQRDTKRIILEGPLKYSNIQSLSDYFTKDGPTHKFRILKKTLGLT